MLYHTVQKAPVSGSRTIMAPVFKFTNKQCIPFLRAENYLDNFFREEASGLERTSCKEIPGRHR